MFRIITLFIWLTIIILPLIWLINNNGLINITWLGYKVQIDILTSLLAFAFFMGVMFLIYRFVRLLISLTLGFFGIFKIDKLKRARKLLRKYENEEELITQYLTAVNENDLKEAKSLQKKIYSSLGNKDLKDVLLKQIANHKDIAMMENNIADASKPNKRGLFSKIFNTKSHI